ncbi:hypothetical protein PVAND_013859 [Polypedilum vanderplanki]|uniref:Arginine kinase n=1 Tax=Polypedilum vanderplanki TaxID=319348 RepID=A0A9J6CS03_POLVA|nr:hypothetical protein PVAND_013859 [Polypedilum vanderplanki]
MNRRKRNANGTHGLYYHSSVPKVYPNSDDFGKIQYEFSKNIASKTNALVIKPSNIRIWIHDKDIDKLMKVVLEGHGQKLRQEISSNTKVKRFLEYVPHFLGLIKSIHTAVIENNIELLRAKTSPPVPPQMLSCKDVNGLTPLHKAAGLGHTKILEYLLEVWPNAVQEVDNSGKSALHYASATKNNERAFNLLVQAGADEMAMDGRGKMPAYYKKSKNSEEIDRTLLTVIPDAPRIAEQGFPSNFTWDILPAKFYEAPLRVAHSELNLSNNINDGGMKPSVSSFEIISRSDDMYNNGEEETHEEEITKVEIKKVNRPKSFTKRDVNNNSAKRAPTPIPPPLPQEENDDDDVETVQTAEAETILPNTKIENGNDAIENEMDNDGEQDYPNETDNNVVNDSNDVDSENVLDQEQENVDASLADNEENDDYNNNNEKQEEEQEDDDENIENSNEEQIENPIEEQTENVENLLEKEEAQEDESMTIVNNNDDSAYETNGNDIVSRIQSSDTNNGEHEEEVEGNELEPNNVDQETGEMQEEETETELIIETKADILIIESNENSDDSNSNKIDEDEESALSENENNKEIEIIESVEIVIVNQEVTSAENPRETGDSTEVDNLKEDENMSEGEDGEDEEEENNDVGSPSPPFEGIIREDPEKQNESQGGEFEKQNGANNNNDENEPQQEDDIQKIINSGDMEQLAALVLDGNGKKLVGRISKQPDIQAFLENVPIYMSKIHKVHVAAREGSLRDLQAALDRRKFSTAKDDISVKGTSPLHVGIIFGHTAIIRYLGSRFPETLQAVDEDNRTALHYAATIKDNGHFYNLLVTLGANPKALDNFGKTAEFYLNHDESDKILSHKDLLRSFGAAEELADEMLNDQVPDDYHSARRRLDDPDVLTTLERCYRLIQDKRASVFDRPVSRNGSLTGSASSLRLSVTSYLAKFLKRPIFEKIKHRQTRLDHNLFDVIWPAMKKTSNERRIDEDLNAGVVAPDFDVYVVFQEFFVPLIKDLHGIGQKESLKEHPRMDFFPPYIIETDDDLYQSPIHNPIESSGGKVQDIHWNLDTYAKWVLGGVVECCRNLEDFELPLNLTIGKIEQSERIMTGKLLSKEFSAAINEEGLGQYYTMNEVLENPSEIRTVLATNGLLVPLLNHADSQQQPESQAINGPYYPYGRGVYISASRTLVAWINVQEHLRILACTPLNQVADIGMAYSKVGRAMMFLENCLNFRHSYYLGYLASRPSFLGTSLRLTVTLDVPQLSKDLDNLRQLCLIRGLHMKTRTNFDSILVSNTQCMSITEWKLLQEFCSAVTNILQLEKDLSMSNSMHIADMLLKIFRKKKNSLANINE